MDKLERKVIELMPEAYDRLPIDLVAEGYEPYRHAMRKRVDDAYICYRQKQNSPYFEFAAIVRDGNAR